MTVGDLIFVGFNSRVVALHRETGEIVWTWRSPKGSGYVTVLLDDDRLIVSVMGYTYALEQASGRQLWFNELHGFGSGVASLASVRGVAGPLISAASELAEQASRQNTASPTQSGGAVL